MNNINLTRDELNKLVKENNLEVYPQEQFNSYIELNKELLIKGETSDLDDIEKSEYNALQEEIKSFKKVEVYNIAENSKSRIEKSICYVRPKQVEWTEEIQKSESGEDEKVKTGVYIDTVLNRALDRVGQKYGHIQKSEEEDLEKSGEGSRGGKVIGHTKSGKPIYEIGNKVKYFHPGLNKYLHGKVTDYKHSDDGNHTYTIKREGTTDYHEGIKQHDMTFRKSENNDIEKSEEEDLEKGGVGSGRHALYLRGGSIGEGGDRSKYHPAHGKLVDIYEDAESAKTAAKNYNKILSPGEKKYYGMKYHTKPYNAKFHERESK